MNIYSGNYKRLMIIPILLIIFFAFFIPKIKYGIDFTGGILTTIEFEREVEDYKIKEILEKFTKTYSIRSYKTMTGFLIEIETPGDENLLKILDNYERSIKIDEEISSIETELAFLRQRAENESIIEKIKELEEKRKEKYKEIRKIFNETIYLSNKFFGYEKFTFDEKISSSEIVKKINEIYLECKDNWKKVFIKEFERIGEIKRYSLEEISPSLSIYFIDRVKNVAIISIILMIILVLFIFRLPIPAIIVMSGATADLIACLGFMGLFNIPLSLSTFTALMIVIGLSLDTDMTLCLKVLKVGEGDIRERAYEAMKTGFAMSTTTLAAFFTLFLLGEFTKISVYYYIGLIGTVALVGDLIFTWLLNAPLVLLYKEVVK